MNNNFKRTFNAVKMSRKRQEEIRAGLSSLLYEKHKEGYLMSENTISSKKSRVLVIAIAAILSLSLVGFAFGHQIIQLLGGGRIEQGKTSDGKDFVSIDAGFISDPVKVENNQIYFILDGSNTNITDQCSDSSYYKYETTDDNGYRHVVLIGGTADNIGFAEFVWDKGGNFLGSNASTSSSEKPEWLKSATSKLLSK